MGVLFQFQSVDILNSPSQLGSGLQDLSAAQGVKGLVGRSARAGERCASGQESGMHGVRQQHLMCSASTRDSSLCHAAMLVDLTSVIYSC